MTAASGVWIVSDQPASGAALGFQDYAAALADAIRGGGPGRFTIGLYGPWGSGKSTLLGAIRDQLAGDEQLVVAEFDAWRYANEDHIIVPLLHTLHTAARDAGLRAVQENLRRAIEALVFSLSLKVAGVGVDAKAARANWKGGGLPALDNAFAAPFSALRGLPEALGGRRIVVLIDDLDRCSPTSVVAALEAVNVVMDVDGFVFVLALDFDVLTAAIRRRFEHLELPHVFVEKMVQIPFRVPPIDIDRPEFLEELVPNWAAHFEGLPDAIAKRLVDMARLGLERNPRQLKRLLNTFGVVRRIIQLKRVDVPDEMLLAVLALQLRWPSEYRDLQQAVLTGDADPLGAIRTDTTTAELDRFRSRFLDDVADAGGLRAIIGLTAAVSLPGPDETDPFAAAQAKSARERALEIYETEDEQLGIQYGDLSVIAPHTLLERDANRALADALPRGPLEYGEALVRALPAEMRAMWERALSDAGLSAGERVPIAIEVGRELDALRWETLPARTGSSPAGVAWSKRTPFSRRRLPTGPRRRLGPVSPPLRLLIGGHAVAHLAPDSLAGVVKLSTLEGEQFTFRALRVDSVEYGAHVVHLHTVWTQSPDRDVMLRTASGDTSASSLTQAMLELESLRLLVLTFPGDGEPTGSLDWISDIAAAGVPAVLGLRRALPDAILTTMLVELITALAGGHPLDEAVNDARASIHFATTELDAWAWTAPVLYLGGAYAPGQKIIDPGASVPHIS